MASLWSAALMLLLLGWPENTTTTTTPTKSTGATWRERLVSSARSAYFRTSYLIRHLSKALLGSPLVHTASSPMRPLRVQVGPCPMSGLGSRSFFQDSRDSPRFSSGFIPYDATIRTNSWNSKSLRILCNICLLFFYLVSRRWLFCFRLIYIIYDDMVEYSKNLFEFCELDSFEWSSFPQEMDVERIFVFMLGKLMMIIYILFPRDGYVSLISLKHCNNRYVCLICLETHYGLVVWY